MTGRKVLLVLAAAFLVVAVALGTILPTDEPVSQVLAGLDGSYLPALQTFELSRLGAWAWRDVTVPLLVRPAWLVPLSFGLVCLGGALSLTWSAARLPRRR